MEYQANRSQGDAFNQCLRFLHTATPLSLIKGEREEVQDSIDLSELKRKYQDKQSVAFRHVESIAHALDVASTDDYARDDRLCLTAVCFISPDLSELITKQIVEPLRKIDPTQYFYSPESMHLTLRNVRTIAAPPTFTESDVSIAANTLRRTLLDKHALSIELKELFIPQNSLSVCGYSDETLPEIVSAMGSALEQAGICDDKYYASGDVVFGNVTFCRLTGPLSEAFLEKTKELQSVEIGMLMVREVSLIVTNAVCHPSFTRVIEKFGLMN